MKTKEFDLSEKILYKNKMGEMQDVFPDDVCLKKDVKEFIKLLKEYIWDFEGIWERGQCVRGDIIQKINKLAGKELVEK